MSEWLSSRSDLSPCRLRNCVAPNDPSPLTSRADDVTVTPNTFHTSYLMRHFSIALISFVGFKSQSSHSYKPIASSRQNTNSNRVAAKRNSTLSNKMSSHGMGTRSVSSGTLNQAVSCSLGQLTQFQIAPFLKWLSSIDIIIHSQSDSDPDAPVAASRGGIMRPTIASQNRMNGGKLFACPFIKLIHLLSLESLFVYLIWALLIGKLQSFPPVSINNVVLIEFEVNFCFAISRI